MEATGLAAGDYAGVEGERKRQHAPHRGPVVNDHHLLRNPSGAEDGDGWRQHDRRGIAPGNGTVVGERDGVRAGHHP